MCFVKDFPKVLKWSVCYAKRADATFFHSIHVYYASKTLLRFVLRLSKLILFLKRFGSFRRRLPVVLPFHQPLVVTPRLFVRELPVVHARAFRFHVYLFCVH